MVLRPTREYQSDPRRAKHAGPPPTQPTPFLFPTVQPERQEIRDAPLDKRLSISGLGSEKRIRRQLGTAPTRQAAPLETDPLARLLAPIKQGHSSGAQGPGAALARVRRRPAAAPTRRARRREPGLRPAPRLLVTIRSSSPSARSRHTSRAAAIHRGPVFRRMRRGDSITAEWLTGQSVALIAKRRAQIAGTKVEERAKLSGHSLRAGYATAAAAARCPEPVDARTRAPAPAARRRADGSLPCCRVPYMRARPRHATGRGSASRARAARIVVRPPRGRQAPPAGGPVRHAAAHARSETEPLRPTATLSDLRTAPARPLPHRARRARRAPRSAR